MLWNRYKRSSAQALFAKLIPWRVMFYMVETILLPSFGAGYTHYTHVISAGVRFCLARKHFDSVLLEQRGIGKGYRWLYRALGFFNLFIFV